MSNRKSTNLVEGGHSAKHESFAEREQSKQNDVEGPAAPEVVATGQNDQEDESHGESDPPHFGVCSGVHFHVRLVDKECNEANSDGQLTHQDSIHFPIMKMNIN